jgi:hypothetical protein
MSHGTYLRARKGGAALLWGGGVKVSSHSLLALKLEVRDDGYMETSSKLTAVQY